MLHSKRIALGLGALSLLSGARASADFFIHSWQDHHEAPEALRLNVDFLYYSSSTNFDSNRNTFFPAELNGYSRIENDITGVLGLTSSLSAYGRLTWARAEVDTPPSSGTVTGSSLGLGDQTFGLNYRIYQKAPDAAALDLQFQVDVPAYSNSAVTTGSGPYLGNGSTDVTMGAVLLLPVAHRDKDSLDLQAAAGFTYRSSGYASAIPWNVAAELEPRQGNDGFKALLAFYGLQSFQNDSRTDNPLFTSSSLATSPGTAGSYVTGAINPDLINIQGQLGYVTRNDLGFTATIAHSITGQSAPSGLTAMLGFQTHFGIGPRSEGAPRAASRRSARSSGKTAEYDLEAKVTRMNDRFGLVKLDKGKDDGVEVGDIFDIFSTRPDGSAGAVIARGHVTNLRASESALKVDEYYKEVWIEEGFTARRAVR